MSHIKILITYHDEHLAIRSNILMPIQTGCSVANKRFENMLQDDVGENISDKNIRYNELSAQYWAWKNLEKLANPDYIGFMHYRRHFMFDGWIGNKDFVWLPGSSVYFIPEINENYLTHMTDDNIKKALAGYDCVVIKSYDVKNLNSQTCREQYAKLPKQQTKYFDVFIQTAKEIAPDYINEIKMLEYGSIQYLCNMFIMKKDLFNRYSSFCFPILDAVDKKIDSSQMDNVEARFLGYFGEFLLSVFIFKLYHEGKVKIKELPASFILSDILEIPSFFYLKYFKYRLLHLLSFGRRHQKYKKKIKKYKSIRKQKLLLKRLK